MNNEQMMMANLVNERLMLSSLMGKTHNGLRDVYAQAGYPAHGHLSYEDYYKEFDRHDIAKRIVTAFPDATWRETPDIVETENEEETDFEKKLKRIIEKTKLFHYLHRADTLANIGEYSVVLLGFDDVSSSADLANPVTGASTINFIQVYDQNSAKITDFYSDIINPKFGKPMKYDLTIRALVNSSTNNGQTMSVHESRIIHLAEDCVMNDYIGTPKLKAVYNRLMDLDKILAASAEGFWRAAWPGLAAMKDPEVRWGKNSKDEVSEQFQNYAQGLSRFMRLEGVSVQELAAQPADPSKHVGVNLELIAGTVRIPRRILTGSEMGEMASTQDRENWHDRVMERRNVWAIPYVIYQLVDKLDSAGLLDKPSSYVVKWNRSQHTERDQTEINKKKVSMITSFAKEPNSQSVMSLFDFYKLLGYSETEAKALRTRAMGEDDVIDLEDE